MKFGAIFVTLSLLVNTSVAQAAPWKLPKSNWGGAKPRNLSSWYGYNDYPTAADRAGEQGYVTVAFDIGIDGRMANCTVVRSSGYSRLDAVPCKALPQRARFRPAKDASGRPVVTRGTTSMAFWKE